MKLIRVLPMILALTGAGCVNEPAISIHSAKIGSLSPAGVLLNIQLAVKNENSFDVQIRRLTMEVTMAETIRLPMVQTEPNLWLPSDETTPMPVPVMIPLAKMPALLAATATSEKVPYKVVGVADVTASKALEIDVSNYKIEDEGTIARVDLIRAATP